jgi:hypothetical protein
MPLHGPVYLEPLQIFEKRTQHTFTSNLILGNHYALYRRGQGVKEKCVWLSESQQRQSALQD